jgi:hypothetical protein
MRPKQTQLVMDDDDDEEVMPLEVIIFVMHFKILRSVTKCGNGANF